MSGIVAYAERESVDPRTGEAGILRDEWRVRKVGEFAPGELENQFGANWRSARPYAEYVLEHRYIRRGTVEPWIPFDAANTFEQALEYIDDHAVPLHPKLKQIKAAREEYRRQQEAEEEQKRLKEIEAEERHERERRSNEAFVKVASSPKYAKWAEAWNAYIEAHRDDRDFLETVQKNETFMRLYHAVQDAQTVSAKVKAIKEFLKAFGDVDSRAERLARRILAEGI